MSADDAILDVVVVGGGAAGSLAALDIHDRGGSVALIAESDGATGLGSGAWDARRSSALGVRDVGPATHATSAELSTLERVRVLCKRAISFHREGELPLVVSELGILRRTLAHDPAQLDLSRLPRARVAVAALSGHPSFSAHEVARTLDRQALAGGDARRFTAVEFDFVRRGRDRVLHPHELAAILDLDPEDADVRRGRDARYVLTEAIRSAVGGFPIDAVLLPPILGLRSDDVRLELEASLGLPIGEALGHLPGPAGLRMCRRLGEALAQAEIEVHRARCKRIKKVENGLALEYGKSTLMARAVILATGKLLGGGIAATEDGGRRESLVGATLFTSGARVGAESAAQPESGLALAEDGTVRGLPGNLEDTRIYAAGAVLDCIDATGRDTGLVEIAASAFAASGAAYSPS